MMTKTFSLLLFLSLSITILGQDTLRYNDYITHVLLHHPLAKQANLLDNQTAAYILKAKGQLDPVITSGLNRKYFKSQNYYTESLTEIKFKTASPISASVGYEHNSGGFLNTDLTLPDDGLLFASVHVPLLNGFLFDETRYALKEANLIELKNNIDKAILINDLVYNATISYIHWLKLHRELDIYEENLELSIKNHLAIVDLFVGGDYPAMDTIESNANINTNQTTVLINKIKTLKVKQMVQYYLWDEDLNPLELADDVYPEDIFNGINSYQETSLLDIMLLESPILQKYELELSLLELDQRLLKERGKPVLDLSFYTLANLGENRFLDNQSFKDYKLGLNFSYPIFNRKNNGDKELNDIQQKEVLLERNLKTTELEIKFTAFMNQGNLQIEQLNLLDVNIAELTKLYQLEIDKFTLGEGSVFMINKRQEALIKQKIIYNETLFSLENIVENMRYLLFDSEKFTEILDN